MKINPDKAYKLINPVFMKVFRRSLSEKTFRQFIKNYFVGGFGVLLNYTMFNTMIYCGLSIKVSNMITYSVLFIVIFILQKNFTYKPGHFSVMQPLLFLVNVIVYGLLDTLMLLYLINKLHITPLISKIVSIACLSPLSFLSQKFIVFRERKNVRT